VGFVGRRPLLRGYARSPSNLQPLPAAIAGEVGLTPPGRAQSESGSAAVRTMRGVSVYEVRGTCFVLCIHRSLIVGCDEERSFGQIHRLNSRGFFSATQEFSR
jgi:hypothetical protein